MHLKKYNTWVVHNSDSGAFTQNDTKDGGL